MKILVVDDSKAMRMIVLRTLRQAGYGDHTLVEAGNGVEALNALRAGPYDLVLSDWNMPEMNGIELLRNVRKESIPCKFGFVTSEGTPEMRQTALDAGALFLIAKPFTVDGFKETLSSVIG